MTHQEVQNPGGERLKAWKARPQILQQADQNLHPKYHTSHWDLHKHSAAVLRLHHQRLKKSLSGNALKHQHIICLNQLKINKTKTSIDGHGVRRVWSVLLKPASMANGSQGTLQHLDVHFREKHRQCTGHSCVSNHHNFFFKSINVWVRGLRWSSGSSLRRFGGTVVMRIFTVASAELISKPVSLVSIDSTKADRESEKHCSSREQYSEATLTSQPCTQYLPSAGSWTRSISTTLFPNAATASTGTEKCFYCTCAMYRLKLNIGLHEILPLFLSVAKAQRYTGPTIHYSQTRIMFHAVLKKKNAYKWEGS